MTRVVCFGDCGVDQYESLGQSPVVRPGGCTLNVAVNLARMSDSRTSVEVISAVGSDSEADVVRDVLARERITANLQSLEGMTARQRLTVDDKGERRFIKYDPGVMPSLELNTPQRQALHDADLVVTVLYDQVELMLKKAIQLPRRGQLAVDFMTMRDYARSMAPVHWLLEKTDIGFFGLGQDDQALIAALREQSKRTQLVAIVTLGAEGGVAFRGGEAHSFEAQPVTRVIDTTGAGDAFAAAFIRCHLAHTTLDDALNFAAKHAATSIQRVGAF